MRICFISEYFSPDYGGQYTAVKSVVDICKLKKINYCIIHKKSKKYLNKKTLELTLKKSDIVHIFGGWTLFYIKVSMLAYKLKKKIIVHPMGFYESYSLAQKRFKKFVAWNLYQNNLLQKADLIHCASVNEERSLKSLNNKFKTSVIPFGIDNKFIKKKIKKKLRKKCLFFSRLHKKKGLDILLNAWKSLDNHEWKLDIMGYGNSSPYKKMIKENKDLDIKFLKPIAHSSKKFKLFEKYDLLVLPSSNENFGIVVLESLARATPVLTTNETPWSIIQDKNAGWIINNSFEELKLVLNQIFTITEKELTLKKKNTIKIAKLFSQEKLSNKYYSIYKGLAN